MLTLSGGPSFHLAHDGSGACGIPDGESFVLTGGLTDRDSTSHNYVTRCRYQLLFLLQSSSLSFVSDEIKKIILKKLNSSTGWEHNYVIR